MLPSGSGGGTLCLEAAADLSNLRLNATGGELVRVLGSERGRHGLFYSSNVRCCLFNCTGLAGFNRWYNSFHAALMFADNPARARSGHGEKLGGLQPTKAG